MNKLVVAAAQISSVRGHLEENVARHLRFISVAAAAGVDLIVFPELSLTGYEPDLARAFQLEAEDPRIEPLRTAAVKHGMHVLIGAPWSSGLDKPYLAAFLLSPGRSVCYAKIHVHESESEYFVPGQDSCVISIGGVPTAIAICADTTHASHAADAAERGARLYVASVMKTEAEYSAHAGRLMQYAMQHGMAVLTANYAGSTGGSESAGRSAFWDESARAIARVDANGEALLVARYDDSGWRGEVIAGF